MKARDWKDRLSRLAWSLAEASVMADPLAYGAYLQAVAGQEAAMTPSPARVGVAPRVADQTRPGFGYGLRVVELTAGHQR
jgi:hypothetical protein